MVLIFKLFERFNINNFQAIVFNYITAAFICYFTLTEPININSITSEGWLPYSIMIGLMFISLFNLIAYSVQNVGISVTSVANKISLCIPVIFAFIYYGDSISLLKVLGITLALFAVYFTSKTNRIILNQPLVEANRKAELDVVCTVSGGGHSGQAGAIRHGLSRALVNFEPTIRKVLTLLN